MKNFFNNKPLFTILAACTIFGSCSKSALDNVNKNLNNPLDVDTKFILTDAMTSTAFSVVGGDISLYSSVYIEHEAGVYNQMYNAEIRSVDPTQSTTYNNSWVSIYQNIKNLKIVLNKTSNNGSESGNKINRGIAQVLLAYNLGVLTDFFGDVPYTEAGVVDNDGNIAYLQPAIDKQSNLYDTIKAVLDSSLVNLQLTNQNAIGSQDLIFSGNAGSWIKAAYGLKARYLMHKYYVSNTKTSDLNEIITNVNSSFTTSNSEMKFDHYTGATSQNPLYAFSNARDALGVSHSLANKFNTLNDPRGNVAFMDYDFDQLTLSDALSKSVPNGNPIQQQYVYPISMAEYSSTAPTLLLSYHELLFLKAEAMVRLGNSSEALAVLKSAVEESFSNLSNTIKGTVAGFELTGVNTDLSTTVADTYFETYVKPRFTTNSLKEVMLQKYLAFYGGSGESTEAYSDYRRLKALGESDYIGLENSLNTSKFPLRFTYGNTDVLANPIIAAAYGDGSYVYTENVWWAGGSR